MFSWCRCEVKEESVGSWGKREEVSFLSSCLLKLFKNSSPSFHFCWLLMTCRGVDCYQELWPGGRRSPIQAILVLETKWHVLFLVTDVTNFLYLADVFQLLIFLGGSDRHNGSPCSWRWCYVVCHFWYTLTEGWIAQFNLVFWETAAQFVIAMSVTAVSVTSFLSSSLRCHCWGRSQ